jgi:hypothetical protein
MLLACWRITLAYVIFLLNTWTNPWKHFTSLFESPRVLRTVVSKDRSRISLIRYHSSKLSCNMFGSSRANHWPASKKFPLSTSHGIESKSDCQNGPKCWDLIRKQTLNKEIQFRISSTQRSFTMFMPLIDHHWSLLLTWTLPTLHSTYCKY